MDNEDARFQTLEQLHERRKQVVRMHRKGFGVMQIVECSGLSYPTVRATTDTFDAGGIGAIKYSILAH
jgi:Winged helix-turn helix